MGNDSARSMIALAAMVSSACGGDPSTAAGSANASGAAKPPAVKSSALSNRPAGSSSAPATIASAGASPSASAGASKVFEKASVPAGDADGVSMDAFAVERFAGDADKNWLEAGLFCREHQKKLCTATQWTRASKVDPAIGAIASWTASAEGKLAKVMGGGVATTVDPRSHDPARGALCCDPAVAWTPGKNPDPTFQAAARKALTRYALALDERDVAELDKIYSLGVWLDHPIDDAASLSHVGAVAAQKSWFAAHPKLWSVYDVCAAEVGHVPNLMATRARTTGGIVVRCTVVTALEKELSVAQQLLGWTTIAFDSTPELIMLQHLKLDTIKF